MKEKKVAKPTFFLVELKDIARDVLIRVRLFSKNPMKVFSECLGFESWRFQFGALELKSRKISVRI